MGDRVDLSGKIVQGNINAEEWQVLSLASMPATETDATPFAPPVSLPAIPTKLGP